jgi:hypothetical protein
MISNLMLIIAFAVAVSWPFTALLVELLGWRGACLCYALLHLGLGLPLHLLLLPRAERSATATSPAAPRRNDGKGVGHRSLAWLLGMNLTLQIAIGSVLAVHLLPLLNGLGVAYVAAVGFGSVIWLSQGGGRLIEAVGGRRFHPVSQGVVASLLVLVGLALLLAARPLAIAAGLVLYGVGNGVRGILKGTLPLIVFGAEGYATLIGRLGLPTLIAQAAGPALGAIAIARWGAEPALIALLALSGVNLLLSYALRLAAPPRALAGIEV